MPERLQRIHGAPTPFDGLKICFALERVVEAPTPTGLVFYPYKGIAAKQPYYKL
jgi:hypothetical protein